MNPVFHRFRALGTSAVVGVADPACLDEALDAVRSEIDGCDQACSRFRPDSELSRLNDPQRLRSEHLASPWLCDALDVALYVARETNGLVDPTIGQCLIDLGYDRSFEHLDASRPVVVTAAHVPAWPRITVDRARQRVSVPVGVRLDLGASAKALCADRAALRAAAATGCGVLVSLGGDIATAGSAPDGGWIIRVTDRADSPPEGPEPGQTVAIRSGGLATSGTSARRWTRDGQDLHHVVDPRTARPAREVWRTVTVAGASCVDANLASTASVILGEQAPAWLAERRCDARLVAVDGAVALLGNWPWEGSGAAPVAASPDAVSAVTLTGSGAGR
jgi:thiamine biosynthesis lipoprotein